jgi:hypothetical protein
MFPLTTYVGLPEAGCCAFQTGITQSRQRGIRIDGILNAVAGDLDTAQTRYLPSARDPAADR